MKLVKSGDPVVFHILKIFGIDPNVTKKFVLTVEANEIVTISLEQYADVEKGIVPNGVIEDENGTIIDINEDVLLSLSRKFKVSTTAMSIRFQSLGYSF